MQVDATWRKGFSTEFFLQVLFLVELFNRIHWIHKFTDPPFGFITPTLFSGCLRRVRSRALPGVLRSRSPDHRWGHRRLAARDLQRDRAGVIRAQDALVRRVVAWWMANLNEDSITEQALGRQILEGRSALVFEDAVSIGLVYD